MTIMKKKLGVNISILLIIFSAVLVFSYGCSDDFFDRQAGDRMNPELHYKTIIDAETALMGAIMPLQDILPRLIMLDGLRSDLMEINPNADLYMKSINDQVFTKDNPFTDPADLYKVIVNLNEVIANIDKVAEIDRNYDVVIATAVKGALIGMRAWTYLTLAQLYGQVAYFESNLTTLPDNLSRNIITKDVLIDMLIEEVTPYIHNDASGIVEYRIGYYINNKALLGELYLEKGDYVNAVAYLKLACESYLNQPALFKVDRTYQNAAWSTIFLNAESAVIENIGVMPYSSREDQYNPLAYWLGYNFQYMVKPSKVLVDSFLVQVPALGDPGDLYRGKGVTFGVDTLAQLTDSTYLTTTYITKYAIDANDPFSSDIVFSRAADLHLLLAEALNRLGDPVSQGYALLLLNGGFNSVNPKPAPYIRWANNLGIRGRVFLRARVVPEELEGEARMLFIEDLILAERAMELAFEGRRWIDLVRVATRRNDPAYLANIVAAKHEGTGQYDQIKAKLMNPANWYLPFE
jgi:starch-binding outer membrane protein, SusD/RagB family